MSDYYRDVNNYVVSLRIDDMWSLKYYICEKRGLIHAIIIFRNIQFVISQECMEQFACISPLIQDHLLDGLFNG